MRPTGCSDNPDPDPFICIGSLECPTETRENHALLEILYECTVNAYYVTQLFGLLVIVGDRVKKMFLTCEWGNIFRTLCKSKNIYMGLIGQIDFFFGSCINKGYTLYRQNK